MKINNINMLSNNKANSQYKNEYNNIIFVKISLYYLYCFIFEFLNSTYPSPRYDNLE